jgi:hypothetical protein
MLKTSTTLILVIAALVMAAAALMTAPKEYEPEVFTDQGELFFPDFTDPYASKEIEVYEPDPDTATVKIFNVKYEKGLWRIPSHHGYPADAADRMANAASSLIGLKKDVIQSYSAEDQTACRVEDPLDDAASADGRGTRVILKDASGRPLADVIVGDEVDGKRDWAFMRKPGSKAIYKVNLRPAEEGARGEILSKISTTFSDWIDTDLLHIDSMNIEEMSIINYSVDEETQLVKDMEEIDLVKEEERNWRAEGIGEEEELTQSAVTEIVYSLESLAIAGVRPTPEPLTSLSLASKGFFLDSSGNLFGNEGHMKVACSDGVIYYIFFGEVIYGTGEAVTAGTAKSSEAESGEDQGAGLENRYIFVQVRLDPELEKPPEAAVEEESVAGAGEAGEDTAETEAAAAAADEEDPASEEKSEADKAREEWQTKLDAARKRVDELNVRFAKWYYVISGDDFAKIKKTRADLVKPKTPDTSGIGEQPPGENPTPVKRPSGLAYFDITRGTEGRAAREGNTVKVLYTGWLRDGTEFDKADDREAPFIFTLGEEAVIKGWDEGIQGMRPGGKRKLIIPPDLGYGSEGSGAVIPPDSWLIFDVELLEVEEKDEE